MKNRTGWVRVCLLGAAMAGTAQAGNLYVSASSGNDANDGSTWELAKQTIQGGVDAAQPGDVVWVTNGVYETGSRATPGHLLRNRVVITNDIEVRSVNGPADTVIRGQGPRGTNAIRCVYMSAGRLIGFTITNSHTRTDGDGSYDQNGGGINMYPSTTAVASNCVITGCSAHDSAGATWGVLHNCVFTGNAAERAAGGASCATLFNCAIHGNTAGQYGGGADQCTLYNCTVVGNSAPNGGGVFHCTLYNSIVYSNSPANMSWVTCRYTCTTPMQSGEGNLADDPKLESVWRLAADSPCIGRGSAAYAFGTDLDGEAWGAPPAMGCDEPALGPVTGELVVAISPASATVASGAVLALAADIQGRTTSNRWDFGDGTAAANAAEVAHAWAETGDYAVVLTAYNATHPEGVAATAAVSVVALAPPCTRHVWPDSPDPAYPYAAWSNAAHTIQEAVDAAQPGDLVLVTNGVYETGSRATPGHLLRNRVVITNDIEVRSVNGPADTVIRGQGPRGTNAIRCVYMSAGRLIGFTITNSHTRTDGDGSYDQNGGGINMYPSTTAVASNCVITGCSAHDSAGATWGVLHNCVFTGNAAERAAGGASCATLFNCAIHGNTAGQYGGGADQCTLYNCTVVGNSAPNGGGVFHCTLYNSIVYSNSPANMSWVTCRYTCTTPMQSGEGNLADDPKLESVWRLAADSPCIGRGSAAYAFGTDLDGEAWGAPPAMGCDEPALGPVTGELVVAISPASATVASGAVLALAADIQGRTTSNRWDFGDGTAAANAAEVAHAWAETGDYAVVLTAYNATYPEGVAATAAVSVVALAPPATRYVWQDSPDPAYPYDSWDRAAHTIQEAVDAAQPGDVVWVTNGVYETGSRATPGHLLRNRVVITNDIEVRSVNGPADTVIRGQGPRGTNAIRCVYMSAGRLIGFTITNSHTRTDGDGSYDQNGGGINMYPSTTAVASNCVITGCSAHDSAGATWGVLHNCVFTGNAAERAAGGASCATLFNCAIHGNTAGQYGGGADQCTLYNCTVVGNSAPNGGGVFHCTLYNSIVYSNSPANMSWVTCRYTCTTPMQSGEGNLADDPKLESVWRLAADSPCIGRGSAAYAFGTDLDGEAWGAPPAMGCDEPALGPVTGELVVAISPASATVASGAVLALAADIQGRTTSNRWDFGDGTAAANAAEVAHAWAETGDYAVVLTAYNATYPEGVAATAAVSVVALAPPATRYVWQDSPDPAYPYDSWDRAAHTIQEAVDAAQPGDLVLVTNGVYETGSRATPGHLLRNRVVITNDIEVRSVNGPADTVIRGQGPRGTNAIRCVYMSAGRLIGFTITNSHTRTDGDGSYDQNGGGINMYPSTTAVASNCVITGCSAHDSAGATWGVLHNCVFTGNAAERAAGGASCATLFNCAIHGNTAGQYGGGADQCTLYNCTVVGNSAPNGGGVFHCTLYNSIVYSNSPANMSWVTCRYTCTTPMQSGEGNLADDPKLESVWRLAADSPCIGRGSAAYAFGTDLDGEAWGAPPAMGCDEPALGPVTGELVVAISPASATVASGAVLALAADIQGRTTSNRWDFGDGTAAANAAEVAHAWAETGDYAVVLTAYNATHPEGVAATAAVRVVQALEEHAVTAMAGPGGVIEPEGTIRVAHGGTAGFRIQSSPGFHIARVLVDGQDVAEFDAQSVEYVCTLTGVTADHGVEARFNSAPVIGVAVAPTQGVAPLRVKFDFGPSVDLEDNIVRSEVDWSEDATADWSAVGKAGIVGEYAAPGVYTNLLRVTDGFGLSDTTTVVVKVLGQAPIAALAASTNSAPAPMAVTLSAAGSTAALNHALVAYEWDFDGDGAYDEFTTQATVEHEYGAVGIFAAAVRVTDDQGLQDTAAIVLSVLAPPRLPPVVSLTNQPVAGTIPLDVTCIAIAADPDGVIESYAWDFDGDGTTDWIGADPVVTQRYLTVGTFDVAVRVTDDDGLMAEATARVTVREASRLKTWISSPQAGRQVWGSNVTVQAQTAPGHLTASVQIQFKPAAATEWLDLGPRLVPPASSFQAAWDVTGLAAGQEYDLRSVAQDTEGNEVVSETVTVRVEASGGEAPGQELETTVDGKRMKRQTFGREERAACLLADGTAVYMPAGSVASNPTFTIEVVGANTHPTNGAAHGLESAGANRSVALAGDLPFQQAIGMDIPYADADGDGLVDGTGIPAETLNAYWFDPDAQEWNRVLEAVVDRTARRVRLKTSRLAEFGLFGEVSLLSPAKGGMRLSGAAGAANDAGPENLTDGNRASYWRSGPNPTGTARFTYGFTNFAGAILEEAFLYNTGCGATNAYARDFEILTSMDGSNFSVAAAGTLAAGESPETVGLGGVTCRFVQLAIRSGYSTEAWALAEFSLKGSLTTDPDADGLDDAWEMRYFSTFDWGGADDFETDGLDNLGEFALGGDPTVDDTDGDGMPDEWEARHGFLLAVPDADADDDGDRMSNLHEYIAGTDPTNSVSLLELAEPIHAGTWHTNVTAEGETQAWLQIERSILGWQTVTGRTYRLYSKTNLLSGSWQEDLGPVPGTGSRMAFTNDTGSRQFFGVGVTLTP